jgi:hypothetical protein
MSLSTLHLNFIAKTNLLHPQLLHRATQVTSLSKIALSNFLTFTCGKNLYQIGSLNNISDFKSAEHAFYKELHTDIATRVKLFGPEYVYLFNWANSMQAFTSEFSFPLNDIIHVVHLFYSSFAIMTLPTGTNLSQFISERCSEVVSNSSTHGKLLKDRFNIARDSLIMKLMMSQQEPLHRQGTYISASAASNQSRQRSVQKKVTVDLRGMCPVFLQTGSACNSRNCKLGHKQLFDTFTTSMQNYLTNVVMDSDYDSS